MQAMCRDYYTLEFMDRSVDTSPIAPALAAFFDDVLDRSVSQLNFKVSKPPGQWSPHGGMSVHLNLLHALRAGCNSKPKWDAMLVPWIRDADG